MSHTPFGYRIKNGKAIVDVEEAEKIRVLFQAYLAGAALTTAANPRLPQWYPPYSANDTLYR